MGRLEAEVVLRAKNQMTLPEAIAQRLGVEPGDRMVVIVDEAGEQVQVRPIRRSYAGALAGIYGTPEEVAAYLRGERESWDR